MATDGKFFRENPDSEYHEGVLLDQYNGTYSLIAAQKGKTGEIYLRWCFPQDKDRKPREKSVPWQVRLGNQEQALKTLRYFVALLGGEPDGDTIPF
jgi:hypothetical protein